LENENGIVKTEIESVKENDVSEEGSDEGIVFFHICLHLLEIVLVVIFFHTVLLEVAFLEKIVSHEVEKVSWRVQSLL